MSVNVADGAGFPGKKRLNNVLDAGQNFGTRKGRLRNMSEKINCLLDMYHRINVRIYKLQKKARDIRDLIIKEAEDNARQNAAKQPGS